MSTNFVQVPPDSTGKKIRHYGRLDITINNIIGDLNTLRRGESVVGVNSGTQAIFVGFAREFNVDVLFVTDANGDFTVGETITIDNSITCNVISVLETYTPSVAIADRDNPFNSLSVDSNGSGQITFRNGDVNFDAFGKLQISETTLLDEHTYIYGDENPLRYTDVTTLGGSITAETTSSSLILSTPITSGATVSRTTNLYYPYIPGQGTELLLSYRVGDAGKANVVRRWGLFDDLNGVFFQLSGTTFQTVIRSNANGSVIDTVVNRDNFNGDALNDVALSEFILDITKYNLYWIDYQWLGVGLVRFGAFAPSGTKLMLHTFRNPNTAEVPWTRNGSLPLRIEQTNLGIAASTSESRMVCGALISQKSVPRLAGKIYTEEVFGTYSGSSETVLISFRPETTIAGQPNRKAIIPQDIEFFAQSFVNYRLRIYLNASLSGATFADKTASSNAVQVDKSATGFTDGILYERLIIGGNNPVRQLDDNFTNALSLTADGLQPIFTFTLTPIGNVDSPLDWAFIIRWKEVG